MSGLLIIFVKNPVKGKVKTRLAKTTGEKKALLIYLELLEKTRLVAGGTGADVQVYYSDYIPSDTKWADMGFTEYVQQGEGLGQRMSNAFEEGFRQGYSKVTIIGSDCYSLTASIIEEAFSRLGEHDVVLGPAEDGGYYLLGMSNYFDFLFRGKKWSTDSVLSSTISDLEREKLSYTLLEELSDVDEEKDLPEELRTLTDENEVT